MHDPWVSCHLPTSLWSRRSCGRRAHGYLAGRKFGDSHDSRRYPSSGFPLWFPQMLAHTPCPLQLVSQEEQRFWKALQDSFIPTGIPHMRVDQGACQHHVEGLLPKTVATQETGIQMGLPCKFSPDHMPHFWEKKKKKASPPRLLWHLWIGGQDQHPRVLQSGLCYSTP